MKRIYDAMLKAGKGIYSALPVLIGVVLLISLITTIISTETIGSLFTKNPFFDTLIGSIAGSIMAGNPITSYILGGELLASGVSLFAVTAFIVAWVTVGLIQLPAESILLGKRFAITRNITAFIFSFILAFLTVVLVSLL